jgi:hypothetical protein
MTENRIGVGAEQDPASAAEHQYDHERDGIDLPDERMPRGTVAAVGADGKLVVMRDIGHCGSRKAHNPHDDCPGTSLSRAMRWYEHGEW